MGSSKPLQTPHTTRNHLYASSKAAALLTLKAITAHQTRDLLRQQQAESLVSDLQPGASIHSSTLPVYSS